jgi:hypothetical protein
MVTGGEPMVTGRHYWEVELTVMASDIFSIAIGAVRPGLDHGSNFYDGGYPLGEAPDEPHDEPGVYYIDNGALSGFVSEANQQQHNAEYKQQAGGFKNAESGDRIGCLLDLDAGWLRFYRNGERCGPGFVSGVTGPLVRAVELWNPGDTVTALPGALPPAGAGDADEPLGMGWAVGTTQEDQVFPPE